MSTKVISYTKDALKASDQGNEKMLIEASIKLAGQAKANVNQVQTGALRNSITWKTAKKTGQIYKGYSLSDRPNENEAYVGTSIEYGVYQEFGTRRMKNWKGPFMRPAAMTLRGAGLKEVSKYMQEEMAKNLKRA